MGYSEPSQTSKMQLFEKIVKAESRLTISAKSSIPDVWLYFEYVTKIRRP